MIRLVLGAFNQLSIYRPFNKCSNKIAVLDTKLVNISRAIHCNLWGYLFYWKKKLCVSLSDIILQVHMKLHY